MSTALIGLVGVVVGGLVSGGAAYMLARRADLQVQRASARLVLTELREIRAAVERLHDALEREPQKDERAGRSRPRLSRQRWQLRVNRAAEPLDSLMHPLWTENRPQLARYLPDDAWNAVSNVYEDSLPKAVAVAGRVRAEPPPRRTSDAEDEPARPDVADFMITLTQRQLGEALSQLYAATAALAPHAFDNTTAV